MSKLTHEQSKAARTKVYDETTKTVPKVLKLRPDAPADGFPCLRDKYIPVSSLPEVQLQGQTNLSAKVQVIDDDAYEVAIQLTKGRLSMETRNQFEEDHCYRSTLSATLKETFYPLRLREAIYSPTVVIFLIRGKENYEFPMMDFNRPQDFPVVSVVSVAALYRPAINYNVEPPTWEDFEEGEITKEKMRYILRIWVHNGHRSVVLGALGCGAFRNPSADTAICCREVLQESEFQGRFNHIVFVVTNDRNDNFNMFRKVLQGLQV
ncbi:hypothetical protein BDV10DRAFT_183312 [Aspergillus recurvatus]